MVRLTDRPDMTLDVYRGRKTTNQQQPVYNSQPWDSIKVAVVRRWLLWRGQIYSKTALLGFGKLAVIGRRLLFRGDSCGGPTVHL